MQSLLTDGKNSNWHIFSAFLLGNFRQRNNTDESLTRSALLASMQCKWKSVIQAPRFLFVLHLTMGLHIINLLDAKTIRRSQHLAA